MTVCSARNFQQKSAHSKLSGSWTEVKDGGFALGNFAATNTGHIEVWEIVGSDVGFRRVRNVRKTPLFTGFCASTCILYWCTQHFVNVAFFTAICSVFRRCSQKNAKPSHASAHFAKCVLQKIEMDCFGTYFTHAQT